MRWLPALLLATSLGCAAEPPATPPPSARPAAQAPARAPAPAATQAQASAAIRAPAPTSQELGDLATGLNAFSLDLYRQLAARPGNVVHAPFGTASVLLAAWPGARGATALELGRVLHLRGDPARSAATAGWLATGLRSAKGDRSVALSTRLWFDEQVRLERSFVDASRAAWGEAPGQVAFTRTADAARAEVNRWAAAASRGKVAALLGPGQVTPASAFLLASVSSLSGAWASPFERRDTKVEPFRLDASTEKDVPMMARKQAFAYAERDGARLLELYLEGDALSMTFVLPDRADGLAALERSLTPARLEAWRRAMSGMEVTVRLPRFSLTSGALDLTPALRALGLAGALGPQADFGGIGSAAAGPLLVAGVREQVWVKIMEEGVEATAVTALDGVYGGAMRSAAFVADRPFVFLLRDVRSGVILVMGRVSDPAPEAPARAARPHPASEERVALDPSAGLVAPAGAAALEESRGVHLLAPGDEPVLPTSGVQKPRLADPECISKALTRLTAGQTPPKGLATVRFAIGKDGSPDRFTILAAADPALAVSAWHGIQTCKWRPGADVAGRPVAVWVIMPLRFGQ